MNEELLMSRHEATGQFYMIIGYIYSLAHVKNHSKGKKNVKRVKIGPMPKVGCTSNLPYSHSWPMKSNTAPSTKLEEAIMSKNT